MFLKWLPGIPVGKKSQPKTIAMKIIRSRVNPSRFWSLKCFYWKLKFNFQKQQIDDIQILFWERKTRDLIWKKTNQFI